MPGRFGDLIPEEARADYLGDLAGRAFGQRPLPVFFHRAQERVGDAHRVVGVLSGNRGIGGRFPIRVEGREVDVAIALAGELDDALDVVLGNLGAPSRHDLATKLRVLPRVERRVALLVLETGLHDGVEMAVGEAGAGHQRGDLLLLEHLPGDEVLDVGMVDVDRHHLGRATCRATGLDGAGRPVADLEERHQAGRLAAAGELLALAAQAGEIGAGAGAVLEEAGLADPQIHDAAFVHQIVGDALDEAGMGLRALIGRGGRIGLAIEMIDEPVTLARAIDAVGPVQAGVEPLRRVGRANLCREHEAVLVVEGAGVLLAVEVAAFPAPVGPGACHPVENLARAALAAESLGFRQRNESGLVGYGSPQPLRHVRFGDADHARRHAGATEILLGEDVRRDLRPLGRHVDVLQLEDDRAVGIADL